jgi:hypothetical protein
METGPKKKKLSANGKRVYHDLQEAGGDCGTEEQFYDFLNAPREQGYKNRRMVYEDLKKSGGDPGTYEQFAQWLGVHPIKPSAPVAAAQKPAAVQTAHPQQTAQAAAPVQRAPAAKPKPRNGRLTAAQRQAYIARAQQMSQQVGASVQRGKKVLSRPIKLFHSPGGAMGLGVKGGGYQLGMNRNSRVVELEPRFNPKNGKMEPVYLTESGNEYTSRALADLEQNEIDQSVQQQLYPGYNDYNDKQAVAAQAPATAVAAQLWKEAQKAYDAERNANAKEVYGGNPWLRGGREMHVVDGATNSGKNEESRLKHFDLQKMSDNAWARVGKQMTASCYARLRKMYPNALERQVQASAEKEARALVQNAVYKYAVKMNAPKSQLDFFLRKAVDANLLTSVFRGLARYGAGTTGDMAAYEAANEEYGKSHRWTGVFGTATGMAFDPTNWVGVYVGSLGGRAALNIGGRFVLGSAPGVGARLFGSTMAGRLATGAASGMGMMGTYEGVKEAERQWVYGGHVNPETRENEGYSAGAVALSALKGAGLGAMTGMVSPLVGNVADKVVQTTTSATGKVATRLGEVATSAVAEGTIFAMPAVISGQESFVDAWTESMAMIVGFKGQHMVKSAGQVIAGMRPVANPRTMEERNKNRRGFAENLKRTMDAGANKQWNGNQQDVRFTKEELAELKQRGYGNLAALLTPTEKVLPKKKPSQPKRPKNTDGLTVYFDVGSGKKEAEADPKMKWLQQHPEFDGYATMEKLMQDPNVSQAARAKAYYMLTGRQLPMGTITGWNVGKDDKGNIWVKSVTSEGEVVTSRRFTDEASAKREEAKIKRQAELNSVDMGEQYKEMQANAAVVETAIKAVAPNADVNEAMRVYGEVKKGNKDYDSYKDLAKSIDEAIASNPEAVERAKTLLPENIRKDIAEQTGVEVDKALGKPEAERTDVEKQAVQTYLDRLYDKAASDDAATPPDAQLQGPEQFAEAYAKHRTHKGRGQVVPATMKAGDRKVYVIDGDVVQYADKSGIDVAKSDKSIVVCDAETGKYEYTSPDQLMNVGEPADPSTLSEAYMANERAKEAAANGEETAEGNAAANGDVSSDGGKAEVVEPAYTDGSRVEINGHEYDVKSAGEKTVVLVDEHGKELAWTRSALDAKLESGDAEVLEPKAEAAPDVATEGLKAGDVFEDSDGNALTVKRVDGDKVVAVGADGKEQTYEDGMFEQMVESGVLKRAQKTEEPSLREIKVGDVIRHKSGNEDTIVEIDRNDTRDGQWPKGSVTVRGSDGNTFKDNLEWYETLLNDPRTQPGGEYYKDNEAKVDLTDNQGNPTPQSDLSSESKGAEQSSDVQAEVPQVGVQENAPMPMRVVGKGKNAVQEEDWLATTPKRGHDYVFKESGLDAEEANAFVENKVAEAEKNLEKVKGKAPKMGTNIAAYKEAKADYEARVAEAQKAVDYWHAVKAERDKVLLEERRARKEKDKALYDDAVAQEEQRKAEMAQKAAEQEALGSNAVAPAIKEKWENAPKVDGGADEITLPNGEVVTGHYVLTESGAASASHQATNGFAETEGYPVDVNGETVNDRDYKRDAEAQQVTRGMAADYDSRALQSPVVVSGDGVVLSGNGRTMAGEIAALNGSDAKYNAYLRGHAGKFGFTTEQVEGFEHPRVVFVPDGEMPYTSETFAKFNQREQKSQSRTEMAVKLGKVVDDALFGRVMDVIGRHESLAEFYADDAATAAVVKELADAGVIPQTEMAQLFDGGRLSESGQAMVEGVLVGKVFQGSPDAVRQITEVKSMRKAVMAALPEVVACHRLGGGYDLSKELAAAVDLVYKARKAGFKLGQHVSQHARQGNLFQLDDGATVADYNNAAVMMLADVMNDGRVTQLKKVLSFYNTQAADSAQGIGDMFAGGVKSKGQIINEVNELLNNGQEYDRRTPSVADGQGVGGEGGEQGDVAGPSHQGGAGSERGLSEAFDGLAAQLKTAEGEERKRVLGEMRDGIARFAEENGYPVPEFLLTREDFLAAVPEKDRAKYVEWLDDGWHCPAYYEKGKVYYFVEGCDKFDKDVAETLAHEYTHADNSEFPENVNALTYALEDTHEVTRDELVGILETLSNSSHYGDEAERLESEGKNANPMLADEVIAHAVARMVRDGEQVLDGITNNPTLQFIIKRAYKVRENERRHNILAREASERSSKTIEGSEANSGNGQSVAEGESGLGRYGRSARSEAETGEQSGNGLSAVSDGKEVAAPSLEGAKVGVTDGEKSSATGDVVPSGKGNTPLSEKIATASAEVNTEPTEAQKEAGNYKKGHVQVATFDITIEQPQGSVRKGTDADGKQWESKMNNTYGYIRGAVGVDGDHIDVFLSNDIDGWNGRKVFVVDQYNPDGSFDEHKVMLGFNDADEAKSDYLANYENGWENGRRIDVTAVNLEDFEKWIASSKRKTKPFGEYSSVKNGVVPSGEGDTPLLDVDGKPIVVKADDGKVELNLRTWQDEKQQVRDALLDGGLEPEAVDAMMAQAETIASGMSGLADKYPLFGAWQKVAATNRPILRNNAGGYLSFDYSFNCVKKDALNAVMEALVAEGKGGHLGVTQVEALKKVLQKHGFLTPCVMCYVEAKRKVYKQSKEMAAKWNAVAEAAGLTGEEMGAERKLGAEQRNALAQLANGENLGSVKGSAENGKYGIKKDTIVKIAKLMLDSAKLRGRMNYEWMMSPSSYTEMYNKFGDTGLMEFMSQGQSRGKALLETSPFSFKSVPRDLMMGMYNPVVLANMGGVRQFSYEDARAVMFFDYYTQFLVMQGARAPEHLYTKRPFMPEMFGRTGAMMNQSLIVDIWRGEEWHKKALGLSDKEYDAWLTAHAGFVPRGALPKGHTLYEAGSTELVPNWGVESFPVDIAMKNVHNKDYKGTVGNVVVAPNRKFILWALDNPDIHMVLAYHANGANPLVKSLTGYDRAEAMDDGYHTHDENGKVVDELSVPEIGLEIHDGDLQWNVLLRRNGYDARKAAQVYLDYCKEHGLTPMFCYDGVVDMSGERATSHPEYYKLLTDFRVYDEDGNSIRQRAVKALLPENWQVILDKYLQQESALGSKVGHIGLDEGLMKEINAVTRFASIESGERDTLTKLLTSIYGKDNVQVLATREFDAALDEVTERGHAQMLRDNGGTVYGFAVGDRIVLNEDLFNANTPMHEHTHVYMKVLKATNPRLYNRGMELWRDTPLWKQAKRGLEELGEEPTDEQIFSECMSQFTGAENEKVISEVTGITDKNWLQKAMSWLSEMWKGVKSAFSRWTQNDLDGLTAEQFGRMPLRAVYDAKERKAYAKMVKQVFGNGGAGEHGVEMMHEPSREETILRDVVIEHMKGSGLDVIGTEEGQRVLDMANDDGAKEHRVYHGSGAEFDHFDHSHMSEGEGSQVYGWGTYVTEVKGIAEGYAIRARNGISNINEEWYLKRGELESNIYRAKEQLPFLKGEYKAEMEAQISEWEKQLKEYDGPNNLYTVEIPDDNGSNYLAWNEPLSVEDSGRIISGLFDLPPSDIEEMAKRDYTFKHILYDLIKINDKAQYVPVLAKGNVLSRSTMYDGGREINDFGGVYRRLQGWFGSAKAVSKFLYSLGYAGIKYPADYRSGGREDDAKNYVIFNENDAEITDHVRFFKTKNGEAYGFTVGGKIYYDPRIANAETPVHEYAHLWANALKANNAKEWKNVVDLMKGTNVWEEVKKTYPELETDDEIADEVLATYSGRRGAERLREEMRKAAAEGDGVMGKAEAVSALQRVKRAIDKFWKAVADFLHIHYTSAEEVADRVMKDLLDGVDPRKMGNNEKDIRFSAKQKRALETATIADESTNNATVVSSADGAKVQKNLGILADSYKKRPNKAKGFITDLSRSLGLEQHEASQYGTFVTENGKSVTIRVSNHNARVSNFDRNGENDGISIVISSHKNKGLNNDGDAHVTEFFYSKQSLERADSKPLSDIILSVSEALKNGEFNDTTGLAERQEVNGDDVIRFQLIGEKGAADDYTAFASRYGVSADMVKDYALGMETGNLQKANFALAEIRRTMRVANRGMKLSEFGKLFRPVQKELAERYGDIEVLRQEYIDAEMRERGVMEAARKRAEEEAAKRKARADELRLLPAEELDRRYFEAVERGDDAAAREMLDEAARRKGYDDTESNYQGVGAWVAPSNPDYETDEARRDAVGEDSPDLNVEDMAAGYSNQPEDIFVHPDKYSQGLPTSKESGKAIQTAIDDIRNGKKEVKIKVYRAVPTSVKESKLRNGDWVTPSKEYAEMHGNNRLEGKYRIIEDEVPAGELWWDGNDVNEWGFDDGKGYKYKNVENSRKLNDLVTRDDNGEIIAPSKRFDENVEDVRYRTSEELGQEYGSRWIDEQTNEDGRHTTQVKNTLNSYKKFGDWVKRDSGGRNVDVLDASSGLGLGTEWLRENGINVEDVEPYPSENRTAPTYISYGEVKKKYDYIISNAVLNVIPDDWRANVLHNMAEKLKVGGKLVINVRSAESIRKQGKEGETRITLDDPSEILVLRPNGSIKAYQKGFTKAELKEWCEKELGKGYSVEIANDKNAGGSYDTAVVVTKNNESGTIGVASEAGRPRRSAQAVPNSGAKLSMVQELTNNIEKLSEDISEKGEMGAHEFLFNVAKAFGLEGNNLNKSFYKDLGNSIGIRISDHYANADNITKKNSNDEVYGLVVKLSPQRFKSKSDANYLEYVYYPDKLTGERQREIVEGLNKFLQTGDYMQLPAPDRVNRSGKFDVLIDGRETSPTAKHQAANDLARQMHVEGEVEVVTSTDGLTGRQAKAKGWYDVRTGRVTIVLPNNKNAADVRETVFHEVVAHKGLRNLVGEEHFNTFLDNVYNNAEEGIKQTIDEMAEKKYDGDKRKATEEYMAHLAEDGEYVKPENQGFFAKVRDFLTDLLRKVGIKLGFKLTDNDLRYILWRSWKGLAERDGGSVFEKAEDVKMQHELGQTDEARSASGENGIMFREGSDELKDVVEKMKADVERLHEGELDDLRSGARAIGGRLSELNKAMRLQRAYDMSTVASVTELAKMMLKNGLLSEMSDYDVRRLLSVVNNVHGKGDIRPYVQKVVDMMVGNRLRNVSKAFDKLLAMRGKKVDARGVEVQGELDLAGQRMADVVWKGIGMSDDDVADMCADAQDRMMSANGAEAAAAATDYAGWQIVMRYNETIRDSKSEEVRLREDLKRAKEDYDAGRMTREAYMEFRESTNDAIRENRIERAEAYEELYEQLGGAYGESIKRAADFKAAEKARVLEIQHNANSDMEGRPARSYRKDTAVDKVLNSSPVQLLFAPLGTFDQMLRMFGSKNVKGEGYLWNRYMRGWLTATENEYTGYRDATAELDAKAAEVLGNGKTWADLFALERKLPKATVRVWDNGEMRELELPQGNLLYIYMVDKMADGRMKLRKMGVTEDDVAAIEDFLDPRLKEIGDWLQEVYLVEKRGKYNEVHERMFGAAMASIDNYFPLKILKDARAENVDVGVEKRESEMASTITGSVVKRTRNALALDLLNSDAFSVVLDHLQQMEHWSAFAEWNRDLNTLLSYKHFRNQVKNMRSAYGSGERLWEAFDKVARIAAGTYTPPKAFADKLAVNIAKGVTAAKISLRVFTALKQFTSFPAYLSDSNPVYLLKGVANPYGSWKWCMENLPLFEKRWKSRMAGDPRLLKNEMDWGLWRDNVVQMAAKWGMTPNGFVDALTVCIGARAMYETRRRKYIRYGYGLEEAERRAKQDASILYNQTQQSSEGAFLSALQVDRSWYSVLFTVFRNSSMSYTRQLYAALRNTGRRIAGGAKFKGISEAFMAKQMERDGIDPDKASKNAKAEYRKSWINDFVRAGVFGYVLQLAWNCGPYALYMLFGDDEKKGKEMWHDIWTHTAFGSVEGLTGGDVWSAGLQSLWNHYVNGEDFNANSVNKDMPLTSDLLNVVKKVGSDNYGAVNDVLNLLVQAGFGVNPQTLTDAAVAIYDYCGSDVETTKECALLVMRVMNCPQSQMDNIYFDEIDATGEEAKAMSVEEIAERYARYKALRSAPLRALSSDALKAAEKKPRERVMTEAKEQIDGRLMTEEAQRYLDEYEATKKKVTETRALADTDPKAFMQQMPALARSGEFRRYRRVGLYKSEVNKLTKKLLRTSDPAERRALFGKMLDARDKMLKQVRKME